jgi:hypothetical protein
MRYLSVVLLLLGVAVQLAPAQKTIWADITHNLASIFNPNHCVGDKSCAEGPYGFKIQGVDYNPFTDISQIEYAVRVDSADCCPGKTSSCAPLEVLAVSVQGCLASDFLALPDGGTYALNPQAAGLSQLETEHPIIYWRKENLVGYGENKPFTLAFKGNVDMARTNSLVYMATEDGTTTEQCMRRGPVCRPQLPSGRIEGQATEEGTDCTPVMDNMEIEAWLAPVGIHNPALAARTPVVNGAFAFDVPPGMQQLFHVTLHTFTRDGNNMRVPQSVSGTRTAAVMWGDTTTVGFCIKPVAQNTDGGTTGSTTGTTDMSGTNTGSSNSGSHHGGSTHYTNNYSGTYHGGCHGEEDWDYLWHKATDLNAEWDRAINREECPGEWSDEEIEWMHEELHPLGGNDVEEGEGSASAVWNKQEAIENKKHILGNKPSHPHGEHEAGMHWPLWSDEWWQHETKYDKFDHLW